MDWRLMVCAALFWLGAPMARAAENQPAALADEAARTNPSLEALGARERALRSRARAMRLSLRDGAPHRCRKAFTVSACTGSSSITRLYPSGSLGAGGWLRK